MLGKVLLGLFSIALGCLCLSHGSGPRRAVERRLSRPRAGGEGADQRPRLVLPTILGVLFLAAGEGLLVLVLLELF